MSVQRDPLSVRYDAAVRRALLQAVAAHRDGKGVTAWVTSPAPEFRALDPRGRTAHERAFTRAAYYQVQKVPLRSGVQPVWSLKLTWGGVEYRSGRWGRQVRLRLYRRSRAKVPRQGWASDPAHRSVIGPDGQRVIPA